MDALSYRLPFSHVKVPAAFPPVNGQGRPAIERLTKSQRAALAVAVMRGEASLRPTLKVVSKALGVSTPYVAAAARLSSDELRRLERGELTLSAVKAAATPRPSTSLPDVVAWWLMATEAEHAAVVGAVGVASAWDAIAVHLG